MGPSLSRAADHRWWRSHEVDVVSDKATLELRNKIIQGGPKKRGHRLMTITLSILNRFNFFSLEHSLVYLQLMACFADINVSQGSVATYARCGWSFSIHLTVNLLRNLPVIFYRLRFDRITVMSLWPRFWPTLYIDTARVRRWSALTCSFVRQDLDVRSVYSTGIAFHARPALPSWAVPV